MTIPLAFDVEDWITNPRYSVRVHTVGRALIQHDDGEWWANGVNPGGVCARGESAYEAMRAFRVAYKDALHDSAGRCETSVAFRREVELIFESTTEDLVNEWQEAALALRESADGMWRALDGMKRVRYDSQEYRVTVSAWLPSVTFVRVA